jgi:hypothetical protein
MKVKAETNPWKEDHFAIVDVHKMQQDSKGQHRGQILGKVEPWVSREKVC